MKAVNLVFFRHQCAPAVSRRQHPPLVHLCRSTILRQHGVIVPTDKIVDTMVLALQHGLPGSLGQLCDVLGVPQDKAKDKDNTFEPMFKVI